MPSHLHCPGDGVRHQRKQPSPVQPRPSPAGRRHGQAQVWAIATSRRHMQEVVNEAIGTDVEWEYCELMSMDRVAFDDRPSELDDMSPILDADGILLYRVDPLGTVAQQWNDRDD